VTGALVLVGTPLGNLGDLSPRAAEALRSADVVACEDTRRTGRLLQHLGVAAPAMVVVNEHTEYDRAGDLVERVAGGARVVLVSDAGMPAVSDPGRRLVAAVLEAGLAVEVVPGPTALVAALVLSGLDTDRFVFEGFLPRKGSDRARRLAEVAAERRTVVLYEAPHRLSRTLGDLVEAAGPDRPVAVARELTKLHEEVWRGTLGEARDRAEAAPPRGEHVLVLGGAPVTVRQWTDDELRALVADALGRGLSRRDAVAEVVARTGEIKRRVYDLATAAR
jgi:16S rRNA (cytidine1402-2'-O)-methyltransferase